MNEKPEVNLAESLYAEGMKYNWQQDKSLANAALSRAALERAAFLGHVRALRELSEMVFQGAGGPKNPEHALWLKWSAFVRGDLEALEELSAQLGSYAESISQTNAQQRANNAADKAESAAEQLSWLASYLHDLVREAHIANES